MPTIQIQLAVTFGEGSARAIAQLLGPALKLLSAPSEEDERQAARLRASRNAIYAGKKPPVDESFLIDSKEVAKMLGISDRTLWRMRQEGMIIKPVSIGKAVRWNIDHLKKWIDEGCKSPAT